MNSTKKKNYILDTNVMLHDPYCFFNFKDNHVIIPMVCIEELDKLKEQSGLTGYQARCAARVLSNLRETSKANDLGNLHEGISLENGGTLRVDVSPTYAPDMPNTLDAAKNDNKILAITKYIQDSYDEDGIETILVSKDLFMAIKADSLGIVVQDYKKDKVELDTLYTGYTNLVLSPEDIDKTFSQNKLRLEDIHCYDNNLKLHPNEFVVMHNSTEPSRTALARYNGTTNTLEGIQGKDCSSNIIKPKNLEQKMCYNLLQDPNLHFVSIIGPAGTGKTYLAIASAFSQVLEEGRYDKIIYIRPVTPAGDDIGYLPGTEREKLRPWMSSIYDAIENILYANDYKETPRKNSSTKLEKNKNKFSNDDKKPAINAEAFVDELIDRGMFESKTFTYMRGRTLSRSLIIGDEAQMLTPFLAKLVLTRSGQGSKFVFIGDPSDNQIDNSHTVDSKSNGLVYVVDRFKDSPLTGHVTLKEVERSILAKLAEECL